MKYSSNWLRELVPGLTLTPHELAQQITMKTAESEGVEAVGDDFIVEVDNKSLTNRPDLWGHFGMAREVAAFSGLALKDPVEQVLAVTADGPIVTRLNDPGVCFRYSSALIEIPAVTPSPEWLKQRLVDLGHSSRNQVVDLTNYVMHELGQPTHAFDADKLGGDIGVRLAREQELFAALNGESYTLTAADIVVTSGDTPVALAGVIGGAESAISAGTTRILLESACFPAEMVRRTSGRQKLRTEASMRFEKSQDPEMTMRALTRIVDLLKTICDVKIISVSDVFVRRFELPKIELDAAWVSRRLGRTIPNEEIAGILSSLGFVTEEQAKGQWLVTVPSWRATKDVSLREDLLEEIGRMVGYASITPAPPVVPVGRPVEDRMRVLRRRLGAQLATLGFTEVHNYSFVTDAAVEEFALDRTRLVEVANPITSDQNFLRPHLLPGIVKDVRENARFAQEFRFFEVGRTYRTLPPPELVEETTRLAVAVYSTAEDGAQMLELARTAAQIVQSATVTPQAGDPATHHPLRSALVQVGGAVVGELFEVHPRLIEKGRVAILDLDLAALLALGVTAVRHTPPRRFPTSHFDLSVVATTETYAAQIESALKSTRREEIVAVEFVSAFPLNDVTKSVSFCITVGLDDRTLTSDEIAVVRLEAIRAVETAGYALRV